jgi:hypothetical protein
MAPTATLSYLDGIRCEEEHVGGESDACKHLLQLVTAFKISRTAVSEAL